MKITPIEITEQIFRSKFLGYDPIEVDAMRELVAQALEEAAKNISDLEDEVKQMSRRLMEHEQREAMLKDTITTAQMMVDDLKNNARKEAEIIIAESRLQADEVSKQAQKRVLDIQGEIRQLKKQRIEFETSLKALLEYHSSVLLLDATESEKADAESEKLKMFPPKK